MLLFLKDHTNDEHFAQVLKILEAFGGKASVQTVGGQKTLVITEAPKSKIDFLALDFVERVVGGSPQYPRVGRTDTQKEKTVRVGSVEIGPGRCVVIAGPCAVETETQVRGLALQVKAAGAHILRGGAFKARTSPYDFQGLGDEGLKMLAEAKAETGLPFVTEVLDVRDVETVARFADMIQIGSRNMQNFSLLKEVGQAGRPILLKRGIAATVNEWLMAAEYVAQFGNTDIVLCERGIRSFDRETRNLLDLATVPVVKEKTFLPVAVDPSHGTGLRQAIEPMALAALACGANAIMVEVHENPHLALSDGFQSLLPSQLTQMIQKLRNIGKALEVDVPEAT